MANMTTGLRKALQTRSAEELAWIKEVWALDKNSELTRTDPDSDEGDLRDAIAARNAWEALSPGAREILHQMINLQIMDGVPREDLQKLARLTSTEFVRVLTELERSLMLLETRPDARVRQRLENRDQPVGTVLTIPKDFYPSFLLVDQEIYDSGDRSKMTLTDILTKLGADRLQSLITFTFAQTGYFTLNYATSYYNLEDLAQGLARKLTERDFIEALWNQLDPTAQQVCRFICQAGGNVEVARTRTSLGLGKAAFAGATRSLENYGLAFDTFSGQEHRVFVAHEILSALQAFVAEQEQTQEQFKTFLNEVESGGAPPVIIDARNQILYDLAIITGATYQTAIEPTQAGKVPKRVANKIFPLLHGSRPTYYEDGDYYLDMIFSLASSLGLIRLQGSTGQKARYMPGPKLEEWSTLQAFEQTRRLLALWENATDRSWSDVAGVNYRPDHYGYGYYIESHSSREELLEYLADTCQPGKWYPLAPFLQTIKKNKPLLLRNNARYAVYSAARNKKDVLANWDQVDGEIITGMLSSSLHELGLVSLGYLIDPGLSSDEKSRNPDAFQFSELAAQAMWDTRVPAQEAERARTLIVQPNFELLLLQEDYPTLYQLLPFARVEQVEMVSRLTLTQDSVRRGVEAGFGVEQSVRVLQACSQKELPQNILYTLQDWGKLYKDATVSQIILLEFGNEAIADEICSSSKFRALELRRLGPRAVAVGGQVSLQVLRTALEKESVILHVQGDILNARDVASSSTSGYGRRR